MNDALLKKIKESDLTIKEWLKMRVTEEYEKALMNKIDELQSNWNSLREFVIQLQKLKGINQQGFSWGVAQEVLDKMNELEGKEKG